MTQPSSLLIVDADLHGLETLTYGFEREGCKVTRTSDLSRAVQLSRTGAPALAVVMLRDPAQPALEVIAALHGAHREMPILGLGDVSLQTQARAAGAADYLRTPTYIRDVVNVAKMNAYGDDGEGLLSEFHGLFYLLRAMSATERSCVLRLSRGSRRGEIRFKDGKVVSTSVRALQNLPALHHMLLWEEARVSVAGAPVAKPSQFPLSSQEILDECERFLRDFAHAARDLGPPNTIYRPVPEPRPAINGLQPGQMAPLLRLFDGKHGLSDVVEESPFRIFDTIRMIRRLVEGGVLTTRTERRPSGPQQRISRPVVPLNGGPPQSMLGQWAMVPDQRGVVGDRRSPSRPLMPFGNHAKDQPGMGSDRRSPSRPVMPLATPGPTPLPTPAPTPLPTPAPIPLTHKKVPSGDVRSTKGEIAAVSGELAATGDIPPVRQPAPGGLADLALEPTVQVKVDPDGVPLELPPLRPSNTPPPAVIEAPVVRRKTPTPSPVLEPPVARRKTPAPAPALEPPVRSTKTPIPARLTPAAAFDAVEADFFAREADLYKREAVDTFDDLDPGNGRDSRSSKSRRRRK
jgi:DNA-binding response OmpR family regulator